LTEGILGYSKELSVKSFNKVHSTTHVNHDLFTDLDMVLAITLVDVCNNGFVR
jgi:hypothetical protein